jgi:hypothetical protein
VKASTAEGGGWIVLCYCFAKGFERRALKE